MVQPKRERKRMTTSVRIEASILKELGRLAKKEQRARGNYIAKVLREHVEVNKP